MLENRSVLLVLGNGPSLRNFDFDSARSIPTLGMNAAYRHWERIDWRPTHYCCLDDALIDTHKDAIHDLISESKIQDFFLTARILDHFPALINDSRIRYLDEFVPYWHRVRGKAFGLQFQKHPAFSTAQPDMLTTGSYAVRFAAMLDYKTIRLLGIDLKYRDLGQAISLDGTRLVMADTPRENPNYFFNDYQQAGDHFNVANPDLHPVELHLHSFIALRDDFFENQVPVRLINYNKESKLFDKAVLPFADTDLATSDDIEMFDRKTSLFIRLMDVAHLDDLLWLWNEPAFFPSFAAKSNAKCDLIFEVASPDLHRARRIISLFSKRYPALRACFQNVELVVKSQPIANLADIEEGSATQFVFDSYTAPISCDWLTRLSVVDATDVIVLEPIMTSGGRENVPTLRDAAPHALFVRLLHLYDAINSIRKNSQTSNLDHLVSPPRTRSAAPQSESKRSALLKWLKWW